MNAQEAKTIHTAIRSEIETLLAQHGYELGRSNGRYDAEGGMKISLEIVKVQIDDETGVNMASPEAIAYKNNAVFLCDHNGTRLSPDAVGRQTKWAGDTFTFLGYKARARKRPYLFLRSDGQKVVFPDGHPILTALTVA